LPEEVLLTSSFSYNSSFHYLYSCGVTEMLKILENIFYEFILNFLA